MSMVAPATIIADLVSGLMLGFVLAVMAHGLNVVWGVLKVVNIAHGEFIMLGAYGAYFLNLSFHVDPLVGALVDAPIGFAIGYAFYFGLLHKELRGKESVSLESEMVTLVATFGLSLLLSNLAVVIFSPDYVGINWSPGSIAVSFLQLPLGSIYVTLLAIAIVGGTHLFLRRTYLGNAIRAYSQDIAAVKLMGVNPTFVAAFATGLGFAITMAGGALLTVWLPTGINPTLGALYAPLCFFIVVLGGPGKMLGSIAGGITEGILIDVLQAFIPVSLAYAIALLVLIPVLVLWPEGIVK